MKGIHFCLLGLAGLICSQCDIINPGEAIPAFIRIEPFTLQTDPASQGSADQKITDAWLTVNDEFLGVYELPATVPVLTQGTAAVVVEAGIKDNGIGSTPDIYPFYAPYETQVELLPEASVTITPTTTYLRDTRFAFIEDFESGTTIFRDTLFGNSGMKVTATDPFEGKYSGKIDLSDSDPVVELGTIFEYSGLTGRSPLVYLEVNYRSDVPVVFGLIGGNNASDRNAVYDPGFNPKETWNEIYFNLSGLLSTSPYDAHQIGLRAYIPTENGQLTLNNASVCLDNIKLVHF